MKTKREKQTEDLLLSQYSRYYRLAYSYVHNEQDALDIVQESAYKAMRDCRSVQNDAYLGTWLYRIVINTALEFLRKHKPGRYGRGGDRTADSSRGGLHQ